MRDRKVEEFTSIFEQASLPVFDLPSLQFGCFSVVVSGGGYDDAAIKLAVYLKQRFGVNVGMHCFGDFTMEAAGAIASEHGFELYPQHCPDTAELAQRLNDRESQMVIVPVDSQQETRVKIDPLVEVVRAPVLLLRQDIAEPGAIFKNILHSLPGNFRQRKENFAYSFSLAEDNGKVLLLHSIDAHEVEDVRQTLKVAPSLDQAQERELLDKLAHVGERYLKGVIASSRDFPCDISYRLEVGDAVSIVEAERKQLQYGLLVVGSHEEGRSHVGAEVYRLMHLVEDMPVLAL